MTKQTWGIVSTIKAPTREILAFAAYHLERGAHRLYIYLDAPNDEAFQALKKHPKIHVTAADDTYWATKNGRPKKHQPRQSLNAADAYARRAEVDWLMHIDHDEFLVCDTPFDAALSALPGPCLCARIRPIEALAYGGQDQKPRPFKSFALPMPKRRQITEALYPTFGKHLNGGFLSHVAGKMVYRTGIEGFSVKIHNAQLEGVQNPGQEELPQARLCHMHAPTWDEWQKHYAYRKSKGAYRDELKAPFDKDKGGLNLHTVLSQIETQSGADGLRAFYDEVCTARPALLDGLEHYGLLHWHQLDLEQALAKQFPQ